MTTTASATALSGLTAGTWTIDASHTEVGFVVRHMMVSKVKGRFSKVEGTITVAEDLLDSSVEATVSAASIDTRDENRDNHLRSADFFDVETHPEWTFRSTGLRPDGSDYLLDGDLTLKGVTRPVTFELEFNGAAANPLAGGKPTAGFSAETEISRKDFGLEWNVALETGGVLVGDKVKLVLEIEAGKSA
ncbi:YceI family protein [Angustibacter sp. McL0619]|uniref:YceI family protein n=1 Tax=Angustibacter sp. McL0619 TaxID=3415676 RepID=UPI003CEA420A